MRNKILFVYRVTLGEVVVAEVGENFSLKRQRARKDILTHRGVNQDTASTLVNFFLLFVDYFRCFVEMKSF